MRENRSCKNNPNCRFQLYVIPLSLQQGDTSCSDWAISSLFLNLAEAAASAASIYGPEQRYASCTNHHTQCQACTVHRAWNPARCCWGWSAVRARSALLLWRHLPEEDTSLWFPLLSSYVSNISWVELRIYNLQSVKTVLLLARYLDTTDVVSVKTWASFLSNPHVSGNFLNYNGLIILECGHWT